MTSQDMTNRDLAGQELQPEQAPSTPLEGFAPVSEGSASRSAAKRTWRNSRWWISMAVALFLILPIALNNYQVHILDLVVLYMILAIGLDLTMGYCGQMNLAHAAFYAVGAYTSAILTTRFHFTFWEALPISIVFSTACGILIGLPSLKVRSHYLAIATLGLAIAINDMLVNLNGLTGGPTGITGIPKPHVFGVALDSEYLYYYLVLTFTVLLFLLAKIITTHSIGRSFRAVREDHIASQALGINIAKQQILAFALSGMYAGVAGVLYAHMLSYVSPDTFQMNEMFFMLTIVVIGGMGNIYGSIAGAVILIVAREWLNQFQNWQQVVYGALIVALVVFLPGGLVSIKTLFQHRKRSQLYRVK
ncbi:branched-chain amino acid ABC transporter permease [Fodinisporobacter ferrooxydans]|uniref:Branched-chain amino acid ABC transporter permease n=1 Tax=Fodinisporobacter ferrooxydans TaxID=2901836 RepID=A0ABY4CKY7_9BACL|nr:branched-chain amino acid ABC transporter permease [Alicyclobacillaceae bacterium MYW30-H2]UOF91172.1 branched-chain amino acid ABC transporter permease [Alicyclobacillaceae bacterium MYW30-H2]